MSLRSPTHVTLSWCKCIPLCGRGAGCECVRGDGLGTGVFRGVGRDEEDGCGSGFGSFLGG